jgi:hypothetical protein
MKDSLTNRILAAVAQTTFMLLLGSCNAILGIELGAAATGSGVHQREHLPGRHEGLQRAVRGRLDLLLDQ